MRRTVSAIKHDSLPRKAVFACVDKEFPVLLNKREILFVSTYIRKIVGFFVDKTAFYPFFFLVAGFVPFPSGTSHQKLHAHLLSEAPDPKMYSPELPWDVARLISAMMDTDPAGRPATAEEIIKALAPFTAGGRDDLKRLLKESLAPGPKPHYEPVPAVHGADDGSESVLLEALSSEITESLSSRIAVDEMTADEILPPVITDPAADNAESGSFDEEPSESDLSSALGPLLWFIAALLEGRDFQDCGRFANAAASLCVECVGAGGAWTRAEAVERFEAIGNRQ